MARRPAFPFALLALALLLTGPASSAPDVGALRGELQARTQRRSDAQAESRALREELVRLNAQLEELKAVEAADVRSLGGKRARLDALNAREALLREEMGRNQTALARLLGALELYRRSPPPALLVSPRSARDAVRAAILLKAVQPELAGRAAVFRARAEELTRVRRAITAVSEDLFTSESSLADARTSVERTIREKGALQRQLDADAVDAARGAQSLTQQLKSLGVAPGAPGQFANAAPSKGPSRMQAPVQGTLIRRFGQRAPGGGVGGDGWTWRSGPAALVRAPAAGLVEYSGPLKGWGGVLILNVGGGYHLVLAGLDRIGVPSGRRVAAGETVAAMGGGGAPELYLEMRKESGPVDPAPWLR